MSRSQAEADRRIVARGQAHLRRWSLVSSDGATVTAWSNQARDRSGPDALPVVACAGLGTPPDAWPRLMADPERYRMVGTYYRGTEGAPRPPGPLPTVEDHVRDVIAVMDAHEIERAIFLGWSMGVNIACEAALRHPDRVAGILGVAGVPGDTFSALFGPLPVPAPLRRPLGRAGSHAMSALGPVLGAIARRVPIREAAWVLRHAGAVTPNASQVALESLLRELLAHDFQWYFRLARGSGAHARVDLSAIKVPVTMLAGRWDLITSAAETERCAERIPDCRFVMLNGTHFLPVENPEECERELRALAKRCGW